MGEKVVWAEPQRLGRQCRSRKKARRWGCFKNVVAALVLNRGQVN